MAIISIPKIRFCGGKVAEMLKENGVIDMG